MRYYMHGESIKQISKSLGIPENTVKSRLDTGRKHMRKEFDMENYTKQSYEPETLRLSFSGKMGMNGEPLSVVGNRKIEMNLLILAYEKPVTVPELAKAIGISSAYIEPIVDALVDGELMKRVSDRVYTDFIIFTRKDRTANIALEKSIADKHYKEIWSIVEKGWRSLEVRRFTSLSPNMQGRSLKAFLQSARCRMLWVISAMRLLVLCLLRIIPTEKTAGNGTLWETASRQIKMRQTFIPSAARLRKLWRITAEKGRW